MSERVQEILSWYRAESPGTIANLARILQHGSLGGTGRLVILPVDQGFEHGPARSFAPNPAAYDPRYHLDLAVTAGCNAYAAPLGSASALGFERTLLAKPDRGQARLTLTRAHLYSEG
jgi:class I fructose-bisphosphate aldolase